MLPKPVSTILAKKAIESRSLLSLDIHFATAAKRVRRFCNAVRRDSGYRYKRCPLNETETLTKSFSQLPKMI